MADMNLMLRIRANAQGALSGIQSVRGKIHELTSGVRGLAAMLGLAFSARGIGRAAEEYSVIEGRLQAVTKSTEEFAQAKDDVFRIAQESRQPLAATAELYQRIALNADELNISQARIAGVVDTVNKSLAITKTAGPAAEAAVVQFGQALGSGVLRGDELRSILEQAPGLAKALADGLGVSVGKLRELGNEGKLSAQAVIQALESQADAVDAQFAKVETTGGQALTVIQNSMTRAIGEINRGTGAGTAFGDMLMDIAKWLDSGALVDGLIEGINLWSQAIGSLGDDIDDAKRWLSELSEDGTESSFDLARAFIEIPLNLRTMIQLVASEIAAFFDRTVTRARLAARTIKDIFTLNFSDLSNVREEALRSGQVSRDALAKTQGDILAKRQEALDEQARKRDERRQAARDRQNKRELEQAERQAARLAAAGRAIDLGGGSAKSSGRAKADDTARYVEQLERQAATLNMTAAQVRQYELAEKSLTGALLERARAALSVLDADDLKQRAEKNAAANAQLQVTLLRAQGDTAGAALLEIQNRYRKQLKEFEKEGNAAGKAIIEQLIPVEQAKVRLDELRAAIDKAMQGKTRDEQSIEAQVNAGLISQTEARSRLLGLHRDTSAVVKEYLAEMEKAAAAIGPEAIAQVQALREELVLSLQVTDELAPLWEDIGRGFGDALNKTVSGTESWRDIMTGLFRQVSNAFMQHLVTKPFQEWVASQSRLLAAKMGFIQQEEAMDTALSTKKIGQKMQEAGTVVSANAAEAGSGAANSVANIPYVGPILAVAAMATVFAAVMALMSKVKKFADGGQFRGVGTGTSDSNLIYISDREFIVRSAVSDQPGALPFLNDFNKRGMVAVKDWAPRIPKHRTGGLAGIPAPSYPSPSMPVEMRENAMGNNPTTVDNAINLMLVDDPDRIADAAFGSRRGQESFMVMLSRDPAKYRSVLGI